MCSSSLSLLSNLTPSKGTYRSKRLGNITPFGRHPLANILARCAQVFVIMRCAHIDEATNRRRISLSEVYEVCLLLSDIIGLATRPQATGKACRILRVATVDGGDYWGAFLRQIRLLFHSANVRLLNEKRCDKKSENSCCAVEAVFGHTPRRAVASS